MRHLHNILAIHDLDEYRNRWNEYDRYVESISPLLPPGARYFINAPWHWDHSDHRCPHDAWLEKLEIREIYSPDEPETRTVDIYLKLLGAYHDGYIILHYTGVRYYKLDMSRGSVFNTSCGVEAGHNDWYIDEVSLSDDGLPVHEIQFLSSEEVWYIEAQDIVYEWFPIEGNSSNIENMKLR
jgi:hypothetical protein